jgi:anhydro-N-acetylmuramic acid kinase
MSTRWVIGLASGSSADGVDAALAEVEGAGLDLRVRLRHSLYQPYGGDLRELIRKVCGPAPVEMRQVGLLHRLLGETFAAAARAVADQASASLKRVQCVGCSGHTVWHEVEGRFPSTVGLGMAGVLAERLGVTTLSDFRARDVAAGGHGLPLETLADYLLFRHPAEGRVLLHLGGLARVVALPAGARLPEMVGFEASPCNVLLDTLMRHLTNGRETHDPGGRHAVQGKCLEPLLHSWLGHAYLQRRPPKSVARHLFDEDFVTRAVQQARQVQGTLHDLLCTATHFVARSITEALKRFLPPRLRGDRILLSGGGVRNGFLWHLLEQQLAGTALARTDEAGIPAQACKAVSFAVLAALAVDGVAGNVPSATGAAGSRLLGSLTPGSPTNWARCLAWMAGQAAPLAPGDRD